MTRHRRLQRTLRSPARAARQYRNRLNRRLRRVLYHHFDDGHAHSMDGCPYDRPA